MSRDLKWDFLLFSKQKQLFAQISESVSRIKPGNRDVSVYVILSYLKKLVML